MESYSTTDIIKILREKDIVYFSITDFGRLFKLQNQNSLYKRIARLEKEGIIKKLINGKYLFLFGQGTDYHTANFLNSSSYISLDTALSYYGIISGFPYQITSVTVKKTGNFKVDQKEYTYSHISQKLYWGYEKKEGFLIAGKEKAVLDYMYFYTKGLRSWNEEEFDFSQVDGKKLSVYGKKFNNDRISFLVKKII